MMNLMHFVEVRRVEETMSPVKEEILNEIDNKDLDEDLSKFREIVKAYSYTVEVCNENCYRVDNNLIHEQILDEFALDLAPIFPIPRPCRFFVDEMLGIIVTPSKIAWQVEQEAYDLERYMTEDRSDEDKLEFILDVLRPIDVTK